MSSLAFPEALSAAAERSLRDLGVEVRLGCAGSRHRRRIRPTRRGDRSRPDRSSGPPASGISRCANGSARSTTRTAGSFVEPDLRVAGHTNGSSRSATPPVRRQSDRRSASRRCACRKAARSFTSPISSSGRRRTPFRYRDYGNLATIGRSKAVIDWGGFQLSGFRRLAHLERRPHLVPDRLPQPPRRRDQLALELPHLPAQRPPDHRRGSFSTNAVSARSQALERKCA